MSLLPTAKLDHVSIASSSLAVSMRFYEELGFTPGFAKPGLQQMRLGTSFVELIEASPAPAPSPTPYHLALVVEDADQAWDRLRSHGFMPDAEVRRGASGARFFFLRDPDGHWIEILSR